MTITIYGIKSCSTMKKAFTKLDGLGVSYEFHDYKKQGIDKATIQHWVEVLGMDKVLNKRGITWRKLTDEQKDAAMSDVDDAIDLMIENTSMIKRPIVDIDVDVDINVDIADTANRAGKVFLCGYQEAEFDKIFASQ